MNNKNGEKQNSNSLSAYLSPLAVWALAFGCSVGWGSFVMPGTTFLPVAGPVGTALGLLAGAAIMALIGVNYSYLMKRYPGAGGAYSYAKKTLGFDHGFLCAWMLILTYIAIIWANSTALSLIVRYLFGDIFCFGFSYEIAGYTIYFGEVLLSTSVLAATGLICAFSRKITKRVQIVCAVLLFVGVAVCFAAVAVHNGGFEKLLPAFAPGGNPATQVLGIVILAPWAFIGFESISHSAAEFKFPAKKSLPIMLAALLTGALTYIMLTLCAAMAVPDGYADWGEYLSALSGFDGVKGLPTFYAAREAMGDAGLGILAVSAFCGIVTGLIANYVALSRLFHSMAADGMTHKRLGKLSGNKIPSAAVLCVAGVSCFIPMLGRTAIGWIVDVTTIGASLVYAYTSISAFVQGRREHDRRAKIFGAAGTVLAVIFAVFYLLPNFWSKNRLATESYLILIIWSLMGMVVFRALINRDRRRKLGKSEIVWIILLVLVLVVSLVWIHQITVDEAKMISQDISSFQAERAHEAGIDPDSGLVRSASEYMTDRVYDFADKLMKNVLVQIGLVLCALLVIFSIFTIIKRRERHIEAERILADESSKAKSEFLSNMSHDLRTPMNAVTGYTALALRDEELPDHLRVYLEKINISGRQLLALINDILDMSRIDSGKTELDNAPSDLIEIIDDARSVFSHPMEEKGLRFTADCSRVSDRYVICDRNHLNRILLNLLSNACKFTPTGGSVSLVLEQTGAENGEGFYTLRTIDTGIGMSEEFAAKIFEAFERENTRTVRRIEGTGLGMSITKSLVDLMGGTISLKTEKDKGTEFIIKLKFEITSSDELAANSRGSEKPDFSGKKLLLAEDNPINREIAVMLLTQEGFEVDTAENGKQAVEMLEAADDGEYCAVLMDVQMPVMNGYEASRAIRATDGKKSYIPIIALTANNFDDDRRSAREAGMNAHVAKPFKPEELIAVIASFL